MEGHLAFAHLLVSLGRFDEGLAQVREARALDPLSPQANSLFAGFLTAAPGSGCQRARHAELFAGIFNGSRLELHELKIRTLCDSTAIAEAVLDVKQFRKLPPGIRPIIGTDVLRTRMHYALVRDIARWWIVFSQNNAVMPPECSRLIASAFRGDQACPASAGLNQPCLGAKRGPCVFASASSFSRSTPAPVARM